MRVGGLFASAVAIGFAVTGGMDDARAGNLPGDRPFLQTAQLAPPDLIELVPRAGPAGPAYPLQVTIRGTGFSRTSNTVEFGPVRIAEIASQDGTQLSFQVPKLVTGRGEVPPAVLSAGEYRVTVTTAAGTSNALVFELTR